MLCAINVHEIMLCVYTHYISLLLYTERTRLYTFVGTGVFMSVESIGTSRLPPTSALILRAHKNILMRRAIEFLDSLFVHNVFSSYLLNLPVQPPARHPMAPIPRNQQLTMRRTQHLLVVYLYFIGFRCVLVLECLV